MNQYLVKNQEEFSKALDFFKKDIATLRVGRANPSMLENVVVNAYGVNTPINGLASVAIADARCLTVSPWDRGIIKTIEKAIVEADLGLGVINEGDKIRLTIPQMTEDNRKALVKSLNERQEKARVSIRQIREDVKGEIETAFAAGGMSEDDKFRFVKELDEEVAKLNNDIKSLRDAKEKDIMTV
jgi:ribosome recycling factor